MKCVALLIIAVATVTARLEPPDLNENRNKKLPVLGFWSYKSTAELLKEQLAAEKTLTELLRKQLSAKEKEYYEALAAKEKEFHAALAAKEKEFHAALAAKKKEFYAALTAKEIEICKANKTITKYEQTIIAAVRVRSTIEYAEEIYGYGYDAHVAETRLTKTAPTLRTIVTTLKPNVTPKPKGKGIPLLQSQWSKQRRIKVWVWILTYRSSDRIVKQFLDAIEDKHNNKGPKTVEEFADCIARAYSVLSVKIHYYLTDAVADKIYWDLIFDECTNYALKILLNVLKLKVPSKTL